MKRISVIIPTYKSWDLLAKCLEAMQKQTLREDYEILVINNDINNTIPNKLLNYSNVIFLHELKAGSYAARNKGIDHASGEIIAFTDADCIPHKDWLKNGVELLQKDKNVGIIAGNVKLFYQNNELLTSAETYDKFTAFKIQEYVHFGNCVTANWFSYKQTLLDYGGFDSNLKSGGDSKLSQKISSELPLVFGEEVIVFHPARNTIPDIVTKYRRIIGGRYTEKFNNRRKSSFVWYILDFIFRRVKFNLNFLRKGEVKNFIKISYVHMFLLPALFFESIRIINTGRTERR